jgi:hypothetical protein
MGALKIGLICGDRLAVEMFAYETLGWSGIIG